MAVYIIIIAAIFIGELLIKNCVEKNIGPEEELPVAKGRLILRKYHNRGAFLNLGEQRPRLVAAVSVVWSIVMTAVFLTTFSRRGGTLLKTGLSLLLGGAYSNTYDRLKRKYVVDYFSFGGLPSKLKRNGIGQKISRRITSVIYNLSDFCILIGAFCVVLSSNQRS